MFSYQLNIMRQIILTEILVLFSNAAICNKIYKSVCLVIIITCTWEYKYGMFLDMAVIFTFSL